MCSLGFGGIRFSFFDVGSERGVHVGYFLMLWGFLDGGGFEMSLNPGKTEVQISKFPALSRRTGRF